MLKKARSIFNLKPEEGIGKGIFFGFLLAVSLAVLLGALPQGGGGGTVTLSSTIMDGIAATNDGTWTDVSAGYTKFSLEVDGITTATVTINGSNNPTTPANSVAGNILATVTADAIVSFDGPLEDVKCEITAYTSGTISCYLKGIE